MISTRRAIYGWTLAATGAPGHVPLCFLPADELTTGWK